jgi:hypothetical protein
VGSEGPDPRSQRGAAHTQQLGEVPFGWKAISSLQLTAVNHFAKMQDHLLRTGATLIGLYHFESRTLQIGHTNIVRLGYLGLSA